MKCIKCGYESEQRFESCPSCGVIVNEYMVVDKELDNIQNQKQGRFLIAAFIGLLVVIVAAFFWFLILNHKEKPPADSRHKNKSIQKTNKEADVVPPAAKPDSLTNPQKTKEDQIKDLYLKGARYGSQGKIYRAKEQFLSILEKNPDHKASNLALLLLDSIAEVTDENTGVKLYFQGVVLQEEEQSKDEALDAYKKSAAYLKDRGLKKLAIAILGKAISLNPKDAQLYYDVGIMWASKRKWYRAELAFNEAVKIEPKNRNAIDKLGMVYGLQEKWDNAIRTFKTPTPSRDKDGEMDFHLALVYFYKKQFDLSKKYADRALQLGYKVNPVLIAKLSKHIKNNGNYPASK